jgi:hypothetical protein
VCKALAVPSKVIEENTRTALFWATAQREEVIRYRRFCTVSRYHIQGSRIRLGFLTLEDGADSLSRNVGKELRLHAA